MNLIPIILFALQQAIRHVPGLAVDISDMLRNSLDDPSAADWASLHAKYGGKTYESMVKDSGLIPTPPQ
jgi:hypothetical protein